MTQQYQDILSNVNIEIGPEDERMIDGYYRPIRSMKIVILLMMVLILIDFGVGVNRGYSLVRRILIYWPLPSICFIYLLRKKLYFQKMKGFLLTDCDPGRMLSCIMALIAHSNRKKDHSWGLHFYNVCERGIWKILYLRFLP